MTRSFALLALVAVLSACDSGVEPPTAEVSIGRAYVATTLALRDADSGDVVFDYLAHGSAIQVEFLNESGFEASLFVPVEALIASGETHDVDHDIDESIAGSYRQSGGALTFTPDGFSDTFFTDEGWTIAADGSSVRYEAAEQGRRIEVVLTRR